MGFLSSVSSPVLTSEYLLTDMETPACSQLKTLEGVMRA